MLCVRFLLRKDKRTVLVFDALKPYVFTAGKVKGYKVLVVPGYVFPMVERTVDTLSPSVCKLQLVRVDDTEILGELKRVKESKPGVSGKQLRVLWVRLARMSDLSMVSVTKLGYVGSAAYDELRRVLLGNG